MSDALIDLVAVAYNAPAELTRFLQSTIENIDTPFTLTVIDNNSPDTKVQDILAEYEVKVRRNIFCREAKFILSQTNDGYARAINYGVSLGNAPFVAALNCDIEFFPGVIKGVIDHFRRPEYQRVAIIGPKTVDEMNRFTHAGIINNGKNDTHRGWMSTDQGQFDDELDVPTVSGATYFMRRNVWDELTHCEKFRSVAPDAQGAFLPTKHFYEETWCSYHARAHGYRVRYQGDLKMIHAWHRSSPIGSIPLSISEGYFRQACAAHDIEVPL